MRFITASIGEGARREKEIADLQNHYGPSIVVLRSWPEDCPYDFNGTKWSIDLLRFWLLGHVYNDAPTCWLDTDAVLFSLPSDAGNKPFFGHSNRTSDDAICGHSGEPGARFFRELLDSITPTTKINSAWWLRTLILSRDIYILPSSTFYHIRGRSYA